MECGSSSVGEEVDLEGSTAGEVLVDRYRCRHFCAKDEPGANVMGFAPGGIGLNVIQGAKLVGASKIIGADINPARAAMARQFGMTDFVDPNQVENVEEQIIQLADGGADYSFEYIGNSRAMPQALECCP